MIYYIRDEEGSLIGLKYNNKIYYYIKNLQEDIIGITDSNYNEVCRYEYDSFGRIITIKDNNGNIIEDESHIGIINPYRYRSYYYDKETSLYYLNSRYYNPEWGRFINADGIIGNPNEEIYYNLYGYTRNNPVKHIDSEGEFELVTTLTVGAGLALLLVVTSAVMSRPGSMDMPNFNFPDISIKEQNYQDSTKEKTKDNSKTKTKTEIKEITKPTSPSKPCWEAKLNNTKTDVELGNKITIQESVDRVATGKDVMCNNKFSAQMVAVYFPNHYGPEIHDKYKNVKYYPHFHPYDYSHIHIWYYD